MQHRREIDGLRAVALIPAIFYHAGFYSFSGGYVGADEFFVISGYLITALLLRDLETGSFSLLKFYERRARRILPALFVMLLATTLLAYMWLIPLFLRGYGSSLNAISYFASNFFFNNTISYFNNRSDLLPLLHTWSLSLEEQFYLCFPLLLWLLWRLGRKLALGALLLLAAASLTLSEQYLLNQPAASYYLLHTRAWEFLLGAAAAFLLRGRRAFSLPLPLAEAAGALGLCCIAAAVFLYDRATPFPGLHALLPVAGTLLVILFTTPATRAGRLLSTRPLVGIGLISYSAYLWHQPLLALLRHRMIDQPETWHLLLVALLSLPVGYASWRWVEEPVRRSTRISGWVVLAGALLGSAFFALAGWYIASTKGYLWRTDLRQRLEYLEFQMKPNYGLHRACTWSFNQYQLCRTSPHPEIVVWGDSYAMHLMDAFLASNPQVRMKQSTMSGCGPVLGIARISAMNGRRWLYNCIFSNDNVLTFAKTHKTVKYVVMSSAFTQYTGTYAYLADHNGNRLYGPQVIEEYLLKTIQAFREIGVTPVLISPPPQNGTDMAHCLLKTHLLDFAPSRCRIPRAQAQQRLAEVYDLLHRMEKHARVIWLEEALCDDTYCYASDGDIMLYRDGGHLTTAGSRYLGRKMNLYQRVTAPEPAISAP